jgi:hypothetical protein
MTRTMTTFMIAIVSLLVLLLLADTTAGATDLQPMLQGYVAVFIHAGGFILVAATAYLLGQVQSTKE